MLASAFPVLLLLLCPLSSRSASSFSWYFPSFPSPFYALLPILLCLPLVFCPHLICFCSVTSLPSVLFLLVSSSVVFFIFLRWVFLHISPLRSIMKPHVKHRCETACGQCASIFPCFLRGVDRGYLERNPAPFSTQLCFCPVESNAVLKHWKGLSFLLTRSFSIL